MERGGVCQGAQPYPDPRANRRQIQALYDAARAERLASSGFTAINASDPTSTREVTPPTTSSKPVPNRLKLRRIPTGRWVSKKSSKESTPAQTKAMSNQRTSEEPRSSRDLTPAGVNQPDELESEITKDTLLLRHDGLVYDRPEIMRNVPVAKISPDHAYWASSWKPLEDIIRPRLEYWQSRYSTLVKESRGDPDKHAKFLAGRQTNRGLAVMNFLKTGELHPYQIVGKKWMKDGLMNYDTVHRLVATLEELTKFNLDVTPIEWLRQRLHEVYTADPDAFKLEKVVHNLYHDQKLKALRAKNGFGNIGRPSGLSSKGEGRPVRAQRARVEKRPGAAHFRTLHAEEVADICRS